MPHLKRHPQPADIPDYPRQMCPIQKIMLARTPQILLASSL